MDGQKSGCFCSVHIALAGLSWEGRRIIQVIPSKLPGSGHKRFEMSPLTACFRAWLSDAATNRYRRIKLRLSFWLQSTLAGYRRGFVEFPLDKSLLGRLAPADFWAQERAHAEGVASGVRFVRAACSASIKQSTSGRQTSIYDQSIWGEPACLAGFPARSGLIGTV